MQDRKGWDKTHIFRFKWWGKGREGKSLGFKEDRAGEAGGRQQASSSLTTANGQGQQVHKLSLHFEEVGPWLEGKPG